MEKPKELQRFEDLLNSIPSEWNAKPITIVTGFNMYQLIINQCEEYYNKKFDDGCLIFAGLTFLIKEGFPEGRIDAFLSHHINYKIIETELLQTYTTQEPYNPQP